MTFSRKIPLSSVGGAKNSVFVQKMRKSTFFADFDGFNFVKIENVSGKKQGFLRETPNVPLFFGGFLRGDFLAK